MTDKENNVHRQIMYKTRTDALGGAVKPAPLSKRLESIKNSRRESRRMITFQNRRIPSSIINNTESLTGSPEKCDALTQKLIERKLLLKEWREKRNKLKNENTKKKPIFKVCHVTNDLSTDYNKIYGQIKGKQIFSNKPKKPSSMTFEITKVTDIKQVMPSRSSLKNANPRNKSKTIRENNKKVIKKVNSTIKNNVKPDYNKKYECIEENVTEDDEKPDNRQEIENVEKKFIQEVELTPSYNLRRSCRKLRSMSCICENGPDKTETLQVLTPLTHTCSRKSIKNKKEADSIVPGISGDNANSINAMFPLTPVLNNNNNISHGKNDSPKEYRRRKSRSVAKDISETQQVSTPLTRTCSRKSIKNKKEVDNIVPGISGDNATFPLSPVLNNNMSHGKDDAHKEYHRRNSRSVAKDISDNQQLLTPSTLIPSRKSIQNKTQVDNASGISGSDAKSNNDTSSTPVAYISPFITVSRGKDSARKEYHIRQLINRGECDDIPGTPSFMEHTSPKAGSKYFLHLLNEQKQHLQELVDNWKSYEENSKPPEEACDIIHTAIGQTELLFKKKLNQFSKLIENCELGNSVKPVTCQDLHGYWDTIMLQIDNLNERFKNINRLKNNNWEEILSPMKENKKSKKIIKKSKAKASAALKAALKAARLQKIQKVRNEEDTISYTPETKIKSKLATLSSSTTPKTLKTRNIDNSLIVSKENTPLNPVVKTPKSILKSDKRRKSLPKFKNVLFRDFLDDSN